jgi:membrane fusion protein, multidrug efflux system
VKYRAAYGILILSLVAGIQWNCRTSAIDEPGGPAVVQALIVKGEQANRQDWIVTVPISGNLLSLSTLEVKSEVGGRLIAAYFEEGALVQKDQLLAEIDPANYQLAYNQAAAALQTAQAGLERAKVTSEHARTEKERADNLLRSGGITQKDHQAALTGVKEAEADILLADAQCEQARASLAVAAKALKDCKIVAPAAGQVQKKCFDKGSLLAPGVALYELVDNSRLEMECVIPSYQLAMIKLGQSVFFTTPTWGERRFSGSVSAINPTIESDNRSVRLKLKVANPGGELRNGMYARGEITAGRETQVFVIPRDALIPEKENSGRSGVYIVKDGKAHRIDVEVGGQQQEKIWIRRGFKEGELVITEIGPSLKEGIPVQIKRAF